VRLTSLNNIVTLQM